MRDAHVDHMRRVRVEIEMLAGSEAQEGDWQAQHDTFARPPQPPGQARPAPLIAAFMRVPGSRARSGRTKLSPVIISYS